MRDRRLPGDGDFDIASFVAAVRATGFQGPWGVELLSAAIGDVGPASSPGERTGRRSGRSRGTYPDDKETDESGCPHQAGTMGLVDVPEPAGPGPGQVLVRPEAVGICGSDYHFLTGEIVTPPEFGPRYHASRVTRWPPGSRR